MHHDIRTGRIAGAAECASTCVAVEACGFWSFGTEDSEPKCWLRLGDGGREELAGVVSGPRP